MVRTVKTGELFATFNYDGKDCADMGIYSITSGSTYVMNIEPNFSDKKLEVPAYDGKYYYGTQITGQQFQFNCFCHDLVSSEYNRMRAWLNPRKIGRLVLSDQPYKYYLVKPVSVSTLGAYPITNVQTPSNTKYGAYAPECVVYTGNFTVTFETVGSAYGYGFSYYRDDLIYDALNHYGPGVYPDNYYYDAGLLYKDMCPKANWTIDFNNSSQSIPLYNPGSAISQPKFILKYEGIFKDGSFIQINNNTQKTSTIIDMSGLGGEIIIETQSQVLIDKEGKQYHGRFSGTPVTLSPQDEVIVLPETWVENIEDTNLTEYDSFYIEDNIVSINPSVLLVTPELKDRYFSVNNNGGSKIIAVDEANNRLMLSSDTNTYNIPRATQNDPAGFACRYIEVYNIMPGTEGYELGDVCVVDNQWYIYRNNQWEKTNLFSSNNDFKDMMGNYVIVHKMFGATITKLDDLTITVNAVNQEEGDKNTLELSAEILPRYL